MPPNGGCAFQLMLVSIEGLVTGFVAVVVPLRSKWASRCRAQMVLVGVVV